MQTSWLWHFCCWH